MAVEQARIEQLARRVRWLDRYRRAISLGASVALAALLLWRLPSWLGDDWPVFHARLLGITIACATWIAVEVVLAWFAAVWETEHDRAVRDHGLPEARLLKKN
ncbi:MAG: hypothetical protein ACM31C_12930 [Acidobacteriota bacterium]